MTNGFFSSSTMLVPCTIEIENTFESLHAHVDLDGNILIAHDPWPGVAFVDGVQLPSDRPGLGVSPALSLNV